MRYTTKPISSNQNKMSNACNILFLLLFALCSAFLFWRCRYGFGSLDESFYLTVPYRLSMGDSLFKHEWHLSQMAGFFLTPFVSLYTKLFSGTDGIILAMRYLYTFIQCLVTLFLYLRLRKIHLFGALAASLCFMLYVPFGLIALSYNSMGIMFLSISCALLTDSRCNSLSLITAGGFFAAAVLCCPYLALVYFGYLFSFCVSALWHHLHTSSIDVSPYSSIKFKNMLYFTLGISLMAVVFLSFVFSRTTLGDILRALPHILYDPQHPMVSIFEKMRVYVRSIVHHVHGCSYVYAALILLSVLRMLDRRRSERGILYCTAQLTAVAVLMYLNYRGGHITFLMWSINLAPLFILPISRSKACRSLFSFFWLPGILYSFCLNLSSNQEYMAISSASTVSVIASVVILCIFVGELLTSASAPMVKILPSILICFMILFQLGTQIHFRYSHVFWDNDISLQTNLIEDSIDKGLYVSDEKYQIYYTELERLRVLEDYPIEKILYITHNTWYHLLRNYEMCTYSAWSISTPEHVTAQHRAYLQLNPEKKPDVVYADVYYIDIAKALNEDLDYSFVPLESGCLLVRPDLETTFPEAAVPYEILYTEKNT